MLSNLTQAKYPGELGCQFKNTEIRNTEQDFAIDYTEETIGRHGDENQMSVGEFKFPILKN